MIAAMREKRGVWLMTLFLSLKLKLGWHFFVKLKPPFKKFNCGNTLKRNCGDLQLQQQRPVTIHLLGVLRKLPEKLASRFPVDNL